MRDNSVTVAMTAPPHRSAIDLTRRLVAFPTINPPGNEDACARFLGRLLEDAGFDVGYWDFAPGRPILIARIGGRAGRLPLAFTGHLDVVPLGARPWSHDPFAGEIGDGRIWGRGTSDMKAGIAAFVTAALELAGRLASGPGLLLVLTSGEETGAEGARALVAGGPALPAAGALIVGEPTANQPFVGHKGALWLRCEAAGVTAHGSMPELGDNAVYKIARAITALEGYHFDHPTHPCLGRPTLNVGTVAGGLNINSVPDRAEITVDIRTVPGLRHDRLTAELAALLGPAVSVAPLVDVEGVWTDAGDPWIGEVFDVIAAGTPVEARGLPYFTDAAPLKPALGGPPTVILGPGEPAQAHQTDENCPIHRIEEAVDIYGSLIRRWCGL